MLDPNTFSCERCGECCIKYTVKISKADIERIKKQGYSSREFVEIDKNLPEPSKTVLRKKDNLWCVFLARNKNKVFSCKIYDARPTVCKMYPFLKNEIDSCKPVTFSK